MGTGPYNVQSLADGAQVVHGPAEPVGLAEDGDGGGAARDVVDGVSTVAAGGSLPPRAQGVTVIALGAAGYAGGLLLSTTADLPSGPTIVWVLVALAVVVEIVTRPREKLAA